jgi:hypothetical protein
MLLIFISSSMFLPIIWGEGTFSYQRTLNMSGGYGELNASFKEPVGIYVNNGLLYVSDAAANAVWVINITEDKAISRVPSSYSDRVSSPSNAIVDNGILYIAATGNGQVVARVESTNLISLGPNVGDQRQPTAVLVENQTLWVLDKARNQVLGYNLRTGRLVAALFSTGSGNGMLNNPRDMAFDGMRFYIADMGNNRIEVYDKEWNFQDSLGTGRGGVQLFHPYSVDVKDGRIYVADTENYRIVVLNNDGYLLGEINSSLGPSLKPISVRVSGNELYALDSLSKSIYVYSMNWSSSIPQVLSELDELKRLVAQQQEIIAVMDKLNISHAPLQAPAALQRAEEYIKEGKYLEAASRLADARTEIEAVGLQQKQAMRIGMQIKIDNFWKIIEPYRTVEADNETNYLRIVLLNKIQAAQDRLNAEDYSTSADLLLAIPSDISYLIEKINAWKNAKGEAAEPQVPMIQAELMGKIANLSARLASLQLQAQEIGMNISIEPYQAIIDSARTLAAVGAYKDANNTAEIASQRLDELENRIEKEKEDQMQQQNITNLIKQAWEKLNSSTLAWEAAGIDASTLRIKLEQAQKILPTQPIEARQITLQVMQEAKVNDEKAQARTSAYGWIGLAIGGVVAVAMIAWVLFRHRKRGLGAV